LSWFTRDDRGREGTRKRQRRGGCEKRLPGKNRRREIAISRFEFFGRLSYLRSHAGAGRDELAAFGSGEAEPAARGGVAELARGLLLARRRLRRLQHAGQGRGAAAAGLGQTRRLVALGEIVALVGVRRAFPQRREGRAAAEKHRAEKHRDAPPRPLSRVRCFGSGSPPAHRGVLAVCESKARSKKARDASGESRSREKCVA